MPKVADRSVGGWVQGGAPTQSNNGLFGKNGNFFVYGPAGTYYLWCTTTDGFSKPYDNNTGTPIGYTFS